MNVLEILLNKRWILKSRERELYYQVKDEIPAVKKFLTEKLGYQVVVNPYMVKLEKIPATPQSWMGIREFTEKTEYGFFCMILMFLEGKEAEEQFVLSELTEYVQGQYEEEKVDWTVYRYRRYLIKVLKYCTAMGILEMNDGDEEGFVKDESREVLYENTGVSRYFMRNFTQDIMNYTGIGRAMRLSTWTCPCSNHMLMIKRPLIGTLMQRMSHRASCLPSCSTTDPLENCS